jgi:hypothetical protein
MQFEVIEQSVADWGTDDKSIMMIQISAIPVNYDLVIANPSKSSGNDNSITSSVITTGLGPCM